jgi:peptidyl-prolyl cis-trans isomerase SurA
MRRRESRTSKGDDTNGNRSLTLGSGFGTTAFLFGRRAARGNAVSKAGLRIAFALFAVAMAWAAPTALHAQTKAQGNGKVIEEIIARVNNEIITLSDYQKAQLQLREEVQHDCPNCPPDRMEAMYAERQKNLLRDEIDQQLLVQRAKDMGLSVEAEVIKQLDQVRQQNNLATMEDLQKAVEAQGLSWDEYKSSIRNNLLTQEVIRKDAGARVDIGREDVKKYYEDHKQEFVRPESVLLADIFLNTDGKSPEEIAAIQKKANDLDARLKKGEDFAELAKRNSEGPTAKNGGDLGGFERGQLSKQIEDTVFAMKKNEVSDVIQTKTGFEIIKVLDHYEAGLQPMEKVENEIMNHIYSERMSTMFRGYLAELREQSYVIVKPGYVDTAGVASNTGIKEVTPTPDAPDKKLSKKAKKASASQ